MNSTVESQAMNIHVLNTVPEECFCYRQVAIPAVFAQGCDLNKDSKIDCSTEQEKDPAIHEVKQREPLTQGYMSSQSRKL